MAVISTPNATSVKIKFNHGMDLDGNKILKTKTLSSIKSTSTDEDIMSVVNSISSLQQHEIDSVNRINNSSLSE